jgi:hypothetical protein
MPCPAADLEVDEEHVDEEHVERRRVRPRLR